MQTEQLSRNPDPTKLNHRNQKKVALS